MQPKGEQTAKISDTISDRGELPAAEREDATQPRGTGGPADGAFPNGHEGTAGTVPFGGGILRKLPYGQDYGIPRPYQIQELVQVWRELYRRTPKGRD
jgi:hypothetical protein